MPSPEFCSSVRYGKKRVQRNKQLIIGEKPFPAYSGWEVLQSNPKCQTIDMMLAQYQSDPTYLRTHSFFTNILFSANPARVAIYTTPLRARDYIT